MQLSQGRRRRGRGGGALRQAALGFLALLLVAFVSMIPEGSEGGGSQEAHAPMSELAQIPSAPRRTTVHGYEIIWQRPPPEYGVRGVVLLLHGCKHGAADFWLPDGGRCHDCLGLPEERRMVQTLLRRGYVTIAASAAGVCWEASDVEGVTRAVEEVYGTERLVPALLADAETEETPFFVIGASSGGALAAQLSWRMHHVSPPRGWAGDPVPGGGTPLRVRAAASMIMAVPPLEEILSEPRVPTIFAAMRRDSKTLDLMRQCADFLSRRGIVSRTVIVDAKPVDEAFLASRTRLTAAPLDRDTARAIAAALRRHGATDRRGFVSYDPRLSDWRDAVLEEVPDVLEWDSLRKERSALAELMNVAYAMHEITADPLGDILQFFEDNWPH